MPRGQSASKRVVAAPTIANGVCALGCSLGALPQACSSETQISRLTRHLFPDGEHTDRDLVGRNVSVIVDRIGLKVGDDVRLAFAVVGEDHPLVRIEQLLPVMPLVKAKDAGEAI